MILLGFLAGLISNTTPGAINMATIELVHRRLWWSVFGYIALVVTAETAYAYGCLLSFDFLTNRSDILALLKQAGYVVLFFLGVWMLVASLFYKTALPTGTVLRGITATVIHPHQIPYWLVISAMLPDWHIDFSKAGTVHRLVWSNALGASLAMLLYVGIGLLPRTIVGVLLHQAQIVVGIIYMLIAVLGLTNIV